MPTTDFLAVTTVRNEGAFVIDWLAHHRAAGITRFLVFSNDCDDGTDRMLDRLAAMGWLSHVRQQGPFAEGPQWSALKAADAHPDRKGAGWTIVMDIDEFVNVRAGDGTLGALTRALPEATAITLTWRMFGNGGVVGYRDEPVHDTFTRCAPETLLWPWRARMFKTLFRNDGTYGKLGVHRPRQPVPDAEARARWFDGSGRPLPANFTRAGVHVTQFGSPYDLVQLNHYPLGSAQSYVLKCDRGRANREAAPFDLSYWVERNLTQVEDPGLAGAHFAQAARRSALRAELRADPMLGRMHDEAVQWRAARFAELMHDQAYRDLFGRATMAAESRLPPDEATAILVHYGQTAARSGGKAEPADRHTD